MKFLHKKENIIFYTLVSKAILCFATAALLFCCTNFIEVEPPITQIIGTKVFDNDKSATSALSGIYSQMSNSGFASGDYTSVSFLCGLSSDELINFSTDNSIAEFYQNSIAPVNLLVFNSLWSEPYRYIFASNAIIEGLSSSSTIDKSIKDQLEGEAKFIRAFCHFYLLNMFGDIPIITSTQYQTNAKKYRAAKSDVYQQIIIDLLEAKSLLAENYPTNERVRPNKWVATAFLARVYLYMEDWANAETSASEVINNASLYRLEDDLNNVFLANSNEAIWQLIPVVPGLNTNEGNTFILLDAPSFAILNEQILESFDAADNRSINWIDSITIEGTQFYYPFKYKVKESAVITEYSMVLRLAEQYLIRAEAKAMQNKINEAIQDLNVVHKRAGLSSITGITSQSDCLIAIEQERKWELFSEWGHRWFDLKRYDRSGYILGGVKSDWQSTDVLYPIPQSELRNDQNLAPQNPGY